MRRRPTANPPPSLAGRNQAANSNAATTAPAITPSPMTAGTVADGTSASTAASSPATTPRTNMPPRPPTPAVNSQVSAPVNVSSPQASAAINMTAIMEQMRRMQEQLDRYQGAGMPEHADNARSPSAEAGPSESHEGATSRAALDENVPDGSVPKPKGCAGGGKKGFHLQDEMGLAGSADGDRLYNMILSTVRELAHAARLDLSRQYREVQAEDLSRIFSMARKIHPYLARFKNDWATAEILKQYMSSARRYGKRKGYFSCRAEASGSRRRLDDL